MSRIIKGGAPISRPKKWRRVCALPRCTSFGPENGRHDGTVGMTVDEYETIRLIDAEGLTQEQCAAQMGVARTTAQAIYASARKKLAACIVNGLSLVIEGGEYRVCGHEGKGCGHGCRHAHCAGQHPNGAQAPPGPMTFCDGERQYPP